MDSFRSGRVKVLVATDIASRGIDVSQISHVINYDMPDTAEAYTHRIGRTGRMTRLGAAFSLVTQEDLPMIRTIERLLGSPLKRQKVAGFNSR
jgi:ATP-dependent RNA helicase RhlE